MKAFSLYKETRHPFIDQIPKHWNETLFCHFARSKSVQNNNGEELLSVFLNKGVVRYSDTSQKQVHKPSEDMSKYQLVEPRDLVMNNQQAWRGSVGVSRFRGIVSPAYLVFTLSDTENAEYLNYAIRDSATVSQFVLASKGVGSIQRNISPQMLKSAVIPLPPRDEQDQIVRFLDWKVSEVNHFIREKRREIKRFIELKQSIIYHAVTFGLTPDIPMKKSELSPWVEKLPITWDEVKIKRILTKLNRSCKVDDEILICSNKGTVFHRGESRLGLISSKEDVYQGVAEGDLLIHGMDTWHGAIAISEFNGKCTTVVHVCDSTQDKRFVSYYLRMLAFRKLYKAITNGVRQNTSDFRSWSKAGDIIIALPPLDEQHAIADYIDARCDETDEMIITIKSEIALITEYRTRLISDVVTGKVDVRDVVIPDFTAEKIIEENIDTDEEETPDEEVEENADD